MQIICRMCAKKTGLNIINVKEQMFGFGHNFEYHFCNQCESLQIKECPSDLSNYYPENYYSMSSSGQKNYWKHRLRSIAVALVLRISFSVHVRLRNLLPAPQRGDVRALLKAGIKRYDSLLDVGCGANPTLLKQLNSIGFTDLTGIDPFISEDQISFGNFIVRRCSVSSIEKKYQAILLSHVLEHIFDPKQMLRDLAKILKPSGVLIVRVPTTTSHAFETYKENWVQLDAPRHLSIPSRNALSEMFEKAGLRLVAEFDDSTELQFYGSELYLRGLPLVGTIIQNQFTAQEMRKFANCASRLNKIRKGDQVTYILQRKD